MTSGTSRKFLNLCYLTVATTSMVLWSGCVPMAVPSGDIELSASSIDPGRTLTVSHSSISTGAAVSVSFEGLNGYLVTVNAVDVQDGAVSVVVPPLFDPPSGAFGTGTVAVSISGVTSQQFLTIGEVPRVDGIVPGGVLRLILQASIEDYQSLAANLGGLDAEFGTSVDPSGALVEIEAGIAALQAQLAELDATGQLVVTLPDGTTTTLGSDELAMTDRLLVTLLSGVSADGSTSAKSSALAHRDIDDCLLRTETVTERVECLEEIFGDMRIDTGQGTNLASMFGTSVGLVVTIYGAVQLSVPIAITGVLVAVASAAASFTDAAVNNQNSDAFVFGDREAFDESQESASQIIRITVEAGGNVPGPVGLGSTTVNIGLAVTDLYSGATSERCGGQEKVVVRQQATDLVIEFCVIVTPPTTVVTNVTGEGGASASSTFSSNFTTGAALDGLSSTNWFSDGSSGGDSEVFTWVRNQAQDMSITRIETDPETFEGGGEFGFALAKVSVFNMTGATVYEGDFLTLPGSRVDLNVTLPEGIEGRTVQVLLVNHQSASCGGFAEFRVFGLREVAGG